MKKILLLLLLASSTLSAQELIQNDYEKGYVKDGKRYSVWQYFNSKKEAELVINHTTGKVMYVIPDTSDYVIFKGGEWVTSKVDIHPIPVLGYQGFYKSIINKIDQTKDYRFNGASILYFEVDTLGNSNNYSFGSTGKYDSIVLKALKEIDQKWIPARISKHHYASKFEIDFIFEGNALNKTKQNDENVLLLKDAKFLTEMLINKLSISFDQSQIYSIVEKGVDFSGGMDKMYRFIGTSMRYPVQARRMGIEGEVRFRFVVELNGSISNIRITKSLNEECDKEALRVISSLPSKWIPAERRGKQVRSKLNLPIKFKLAE